MTKIKKATGLLLLKRTELIADIAQLSMLNETLSKISFHSKSSICNVIHTSMEESKRSLDNVNKTLSCDHVFGDSSFIYEDSHYKY